jgi:hypothetical protein
MTSPHIHIELINIIAIITHGKFTETTINLTFLIQINQLP